MNQRFSTAAFGPSTPPRATRRPLAAVAAAALLSLTVGCSSLPAGHQADPRDPFESYNRSMTRFNDAVDGAVLKPVAQGYQAVVPQLVRQGVGNFFANLGDMWSMVNSALQGKGDAFGESMGRVMVNSFIGIGGVFDVATEAGITRQKEDFGQTLAVWGVPSGPYLVLPLLGGSTVRDTLALPVDWKGNPWGQVNDTAWRYSGTALNIVDTRSRFLAAGDLVNEAALDPYTFKRDLYLQRRISDVYDGQPLDTNERYDLPDDLESPAK